MYPFPRMIGVSTYALVLVIICLLIAKSNNKILGKILFVYAVILSFIGYKFIPVEGNDLYRLFEVLEFYGSQNLTNIWIMMKEGATPVNTLYFHLIGRFNISGLLPGITAFIFYSNVFYIFKSFARKYNINTQSTAIALFFFMSTGSYFEVISGIRTMLGFSIIAICFYKEIEEGKSIIKNLGWYMIAGLIHSATLATVALRLIFLIFQSYENKYEKIKNRIVLMTLIPITFFVGMSFFKYMLEKVNNYIITENGHSYFWEYVIGIISLVLIIIIINDKFIKRYIYEKVSFINLYKFLVVILLIVSISLFIEYNTFHRFIILATIFFTPIIMLFCNYSKGKKVYKIRIIILTSVILLCIASVRGNLCSLKFFV